MIKKGLVISTTTGKSKENAAGDVIDTNINKKTACIVATTANISLTGLQTIDGFTVVAGDRVFVKNHATPALIGIYDASASAWSRSADCDTAAKLTGAQVAIIKGTVNGGTEWINTAIIATLNTTAPTFAKVNALEFALKANIAVNTGTLVALTFVADSLQGTIASPLTGNITGVTTNAQIGVVTIVIHNNGTAPTFDSKFKKLSGSGSYVTGAINYIWCLYVNSTEIIYSIQQRT